MIKKITVFLVEKSPMRKKKKYPFLKLTFGHQVARYSGHFNIFPINRKELAGKVQFKRVWRNLERVKPYFSFYLPQWGGGGGTQRRKRKERKVYGGGG